MKDVFSSREWEFLTELEPMSLKPGILKKIEKRLLEILHELIIAKADFSGVFPAWENEKEISSKIYRGENYLGMPWIALDYPRNYGQNSSLSFRILVLWGDGIYTSLLSEREAVVSSQKAISVKEADTKTFFVQSANRWIQHISADDCTEINTIHEATAHRETTGFTRLFQRIEFEQWSLLNEICLENFRNQCSIMQEVMKNHRGV